MTEVQQLHWQNRVVQALNEAFPERVLQAWTQCEHLLPHALLSVSWIERELISTLEASSLLDKTGAYLLERAQYRDAESLLRRALAMLKQKPGGEHPETAKSLNHLAVLSFWQGKYEQIEESDLVQALASPWDLSILRLQRACTAEQTSTSCEASTSGQSPISCEHWLSMSGAWDLDILTLRDV